VSSTEVQQGAGQWRNRIIAVLLLAVVAWTIWHFTHNVAKPATRGRPSAAVGTAPATLADVPVTLSAIGSVQPIVAATVRTQLAGTLFSLNFQEGQQVTKGQLLAQIDPRPYQLALAQAQANLTRDASTLDQARADLERYRTLLAQDSIARQQVDTQAASVKQLEGTVAADRAAIGTATLNLNYTAITAPVSGKAGLRQVDLGNYLTPGDANGIVVITQTTPIDVSFTISQTQLPPVQDQLAKGNKLSVTATDQSGQHVLAQGEFLTFDNQIDATSGTVRAKARFPNTDGRLFPNQFVNITLVVETLQQAVTVPIASVRHGAQGDFVFVLQPDQTVKLQQVQMGQISGQVVVIARGLEAGHTVITEGADNLNDGSRVTLAGTGAGANNGERQRPPGQNGSGEGKRKRREQGKGEAGSRSPSP